VARLWRVTDGEMAANHAAFPALIGAANQLRDEGCALRAAANGSAVPEISYTNS